MDELTDAQRAQLRERLEALGAELGQRLKDEQGLAATVTLDQSAVGRVSRVDALQQQAMAKATLRRLAQRLGRVEAAKERFDADPDAFGGCLDCEELIPWKRLLAAPDAVLCVACMEERGL